MTSQCSRLHVGQVWEELQVAWQAMAVTARSKALSRECGFYKHYSQVDVMQTTSIWLPEATHWTYEMSPQELQLNSTTMDNVWNLSLATYGYPNTSLMEEFQDKASGVPSRRPNGALDSLGMLARQVLVPIVCVCGIVGNVLNIIVLTRKRMKKSLESQENIVSTGLLLLAISDMLFCISAFPRCFIAENQALFPPHAFGAYYQLLCTGLLTTFSLISTWLIVIMAVFRYIAICHPLHVRHVLLPQRTRCALVSVLFLAVLGNTPSFWQLKKVVMTWNEEEVWLIDIGPLNHRNTAGLAFLWIRTLLGVLLPFVALIVFNVCLAKSVRESVHMRLNCSSATLSNGKRISITLIGIIAMFLFLIFPSELMDFFTHLVGLEIPQPEVFIFCRALANLLQVSNFAFNFVLYCVINAYFRRTVIELITCNGLSRVRRTGSGRSSAVRTNTTRFSIKIFHNVTDPLDTQL